MTERRTPVAERSGGVRSAGAGPAGAGPAGAGPAGARRLRRALSLLVLSLVLPGIAQYLVGNRRVGRLMLRIWSGVAGSVVLVGLLWIVWRDLVLVMATSVTLLRLLAVTCFLLVPVLAALVVDAWRLTGPGELPRRARLVLTGLLVLALLVTTYPPLAVGSRSWAAADLISSLFVSTRTSAAVDGRFNVLLLGGDSGQDRMGTRPDSITLASIDVHTGRTVLLGLPRNLENVPFPAGTPAAAALPHGYSCGDICLLNALYTWGTQHADLFPGVRDPGAEAMKQAVAGITGLTVNYYVLIDLAGFEDLINAMGGITVTVKSPVPIGGETSRVSGYVQPGTRRLDGYHALWFARSRHGASDYARMARQRCVMDAMLRQLDPQTLLGRFQEIAGASARTVGTDLPAGELATFLDLGVKAKSQPVTTVQFVPPLVNPAHPDLELIRDRARRALDASRSDTSASTPASTPAPASAPPPASSAATRTPATRSTGSSAQGSSAAAAPPIAGEDLSSVCAPG